MEEDDFDTYRTSEVRIKRLGFKPQKELVYNHILPYADELDEESTRLFATIKTNLAKSVMIKEMRPGCGMWTSRLMKYIKLYGLKFSKEDHIKLIHMVYELIVIPDLEPTKLHKFSTLLILLTKKRHLLSPDELSLPWKPLFEIAENIFSKNNIYHFSTLKSTFDLLIYCVKPYFPLSATQEILDEILPKFNPWTSSCRHDTIRHLMVYLPTTQPVEHMDRGFKLWFDPLMNIWDVCNNSPAWESEMLMIMANLASTNIGYVDWEPYIPLMFTRFQRSFNLPVFYKKTQNNMQQSIDICAMALWIASTLGPGSSTQKHLDSFMTTVVSYLHSANAGRWSIKLRELVRRIPHHFVTRLHKQRTNYKNSWENKVPESHQLTDDDITKFVECMVSVALQAMFSGAVVSDACMALQQLAVLRPALVSTPTIEKMWNTLDSLTEPHKLTCAMQCVVAIAGPLISGISNGYPEGPTHVIPLLLSSLPGLDPNDFKKTIVTLHFISVFCTYIPLVNCSGASKYWKDLTEEEHIICEATAQIEDFVLQFFDRVFTLVESSVMENTRMEQKDTDSTKNKLETTSEGVLASAATTVLMQTSTDIFKMALKKFYTFVTQRILEINVAGMTAGSLGRAFARVNAKETFKIFIPHLCDTIMELLGEGDEVLKAETLDNDLLFNLLLLSHIVERNGIELLQYIPKILVVLDKVLTLACKEGYSQASNTLYFILVSMCTIYPEEYKSSTKDYDSGVEKFLAIREWGKPGDLMNCNIKWHVPSEEEVACAQSIIHRYLPVELDKLKNHMNGTCLQTREETHRSLAIIRCLLAANPVLPPLSDEHLVMMKSKLPTVDFKVTTGIHGCVTMPDGSSVKMALASTIHDLQTKLLESSEDDTKSLCSIIAIWDQIVSHSILSSSQFESHLKALAAGKRTLGDRLLGRPGHPRWLLIDRALLQQEFREQTRGVLTAVHARVMRDLVTLSTSRYSAVRIRAQGRLNLMISRFTYSYNAVVEQLVDCLTANPEEEHERLKGSLYCLLGPKQTPLVTRHDWAVAATLWPAIINSTPSEKLSVIKLLDHIVNSIQMNFPTITIHQKWSSSCSDRAQELLSPEELSEPCLQELIEDSDAALRQSGEDNAKHYTNLVNILVQGASSTQLHWRHSMMCVSLLQTLLHLDIKYPTHAVKMMMQCLIHDSIVIRKMGIKLMTLVLKQRKKKHKMVDVNPFKMAGVPEPQEPLVPGFRPDNEWLQFDINKEYTEEEWNTSPYLHKECYGFYNWPKPFQMYAPPNEQPAFEGPNSEDECDREIYAFFSNTDNVDKIIKFFSMEDKKGKDKFSGFRLALYQGLFRVFGDALLPPFLEHLRRLVRDPQEAAQRCGAELLAGMLKGTKHWTYAMASNLRTQLQPIVRDALDNMTTETYLDWGTCFASGAERMDQSRQAWVLRELWKGGSEGGAGQLSRRLYALQSAVAQHPWRGARYASYLLAELRRHRMLSHPYNLIRERVASLMSDIFGADVTFPGNTHNVAPSISLMMEEISPRLEILLVEGMKGVGNQQPGTDNDNYVSEMETVDAKLSSKTSLPYSIEDIKTLIRSKSAMDKLDKNNHPIGQLIKILRDHNKNSRLNVDSLMAMDSCDSPSFEGLNELAQGQGLSTVDALESAFSAALKLEDGNGLLKEQDSEYDVSLRLFKTALKWVICTLTRKAFGAREAYYVLFPAACALGSKDGDEELCKLCGTFLAYLAQVLHTPENLTVALNSVQKVCDSPSWCARASCLAFLQSLVFHNLPLVSTDAGNQEAIVRIVLGLMADSRPEVREMAAQMMAGLLHCEVAGSEEKLLENFKGMCKGRLIKKGPGATEALVQRHCGVLGLCAFIAAHPYSVPPYLPDIFQVLGRHLNDPLPIPSSIRKTLGDFKRTHHDDWDNHQLKFTEEELCLLSDLSVPPSYYA